MVEVCVYCGNFRHEKASCCGENHWEELDPEQFEPEPTITEREESE